MLKLRTPIAALLLCATVMSGAGAALAQIGAARTEQAADLVAKAEAAFDKGQFDVAVQNFGRALRADDLDETSVAKTLYRRGVANERAGRPAQAIADITGALFLPNLAAGDRAKAYLSRGRAYEAVGMGEQARADIANARNGGVDERQIARSAQPAASSNSGGPSFSTVSSATSQQAPAFRTSSESASAAAPSFETRSSAPKAATRRQQVASFETQSRPAASQTEEIPRFRTTIVPDESASASGADAAAPVEESGGRVGRLIGNLWSKTTGSDKEASAPVPPVQPAASQWSQETSVARAPAPSWDARVTAPSRPSTAPAPAASARPAPAGGQGYRIQLAALKTDAEAQTTWKRLKSKHGSLLGGRQPNIVKTELGGLGTFYRLQLGPFADKAESQQLCKNFKAGGLDCFLLAP